MRPVIQWLLHGKAAAPAKTDDGALTTAQLLDLIKFYEEASGKTKAHAWAQSTWVLAINGAILAFSLNFFIAHLEFRGLLALVWGMAVSGLILSGYLIYVLKELGVHLRNYWDSSDRVTRSSADLTAIIRPDPEPPSGVPKKFPGFMRRLMVPPALFAISHVVWAASATIYLLCFVARTS